MHRTEEFGSDMLQNYKEIFFGLAFGIAAVVIDTGMDAIAAGNSLTDEIADRPAMMLYRAVFLLLGLGLGWLLWTRNRREREYRQLTETLRRLHQDLEKQTLLLRSMLQNLLIRDDVHPSEAASQVLQQAYEKTQELQRIAELKLPSVDA